MDRPAIWTQWALAAQSAEASAEKELAKRSTKKKHTTGGPIGT